MNGSLTTRLLVATLSCASLLGIATGREGAILSRGFIEFAPLQSEVHASTLVEAAPGVLVAAWFAGSKEGNDDVTIWSARRIAGGWTPAREIASGVTAAGEPRPSYNPVLFNAGPGRLALIYSVGRENSPWVPHLQWSADNGETWSAATPLPAGIRGPDRNRPLLLPSGEWLHPSTGTGRRVHVEFSDRELVTWRRQPAVADPNKFEAIQPALLDHGGDRIQMLCRTYARELATAWSQDGGRTWSALEGLGVFLANSALDAVRLQDGRFLLVYNPGPKPADRQKWGERVPLSVAVSTDGVTWKTSLDLETEPIREGFAYPCLLQTADGDVHVTYTWGRKRIRHVIVDSTRL